MIKYLTKLASYRVARIAISETFFNSAAAAEESCDSASRCAHTENEQNAAQVSLKAQIRIAARTRSDAIDSLGPPPAMPINN